MLSIQRTANELNALFRLLGKRHLMALGIFALYIIYKHVTIFYFGGIANLHSGHFNMNLANDLTTPIFAFVILTLMVSQDVFAKLRNTPSGIHYLMLPSNTLEKFTAAWLYSTLIMFLSVYFTYDLLHLLCMSVGNAVTGAGIPVQPVGLRFTWHLFSGLMFIQSIYLLGALYFRKNAVVKTTLVLFGLGLVLSIVLTIYVKEILSASAAWSHQMMSANITLNSPDDLEQLLDQDVPYMLKALYRTAQVLFYATPFLCWGGAYLTLKHKEV